MNSQKAFNIKAKVLSNKNLGSHYWHCSLRAPEIARRASAGQFVDIRLSGDYQPFLRRPFSIHSVDGPDVEILYEALGKGTEIFSRKKTGEFLDVIGPLGNGFDYGVSKGQRVKVSVLVAGGMGVAPLVFLAEKLAKLKNQNPKLKTLALIGGRKKSHILCTDEFKRAGCGVIISTDDGSVGAKGRVTNLLENVLRKTKGPEGAMIFACGPKPMLKGVATIAEKFSVAAQLSLEAHMACGIGACLGCVVDTIDGYKRVCKEGPVFRANQIIWGKEQ
jgi:dihydroorotate dehydrogenase electron transfer subunit